MAQSSSSSSGAVVSSYACAVCLEVPVCEPVVTACGHLFCFGCLGPWLETHRRCPVCSAGLRRSELTFVYAGQKPRARRRIVDKVTFADLPFPSLVALQLRTFFFVEDDAGLKHSDRLLTAWPRVLAAAILLAFLLAV